MDTGIELRIKELCREKGIGIAELAERVNMSRVSIGNFIARRQWPSSAAIRKIADALGVEVSELFAPTSTFSAFVYDNGDVRHFTSKEELKEYIGQEK